MFLIIIAILLLAVVGLGALLGTAAGALFKGLFFFFLAGLLISKLLWLSGRRHMVHQPRSRRTAGDSTSSREEDFEEWHRMAHAREEVDSWVPEV